MFKKASLFIFIILSISVLSYGQKLFPSMKTETVTNKTVMIPEDTKGKFTLLGMAYSKKSEKSLNTWYKPMYNKFIKPKVEGGAFAMLSYDINTFFVPMFTGVSASAAGIAKKKALKEIDPRIQPYVLFYKGKLKEYKDKLHFYKKDVPYVILLDEEGKIVYETSGNFTVEKLKGIESKIDSF